MLAITEVSSDDGLAALAPIWEALHAADPRATPFQSWQWVSSWWKHHGAGTPMVLVAKDGDTPVAILPLVRTFWRFTPVRQLRFMGAPLSDFQDIIAVPDRLGAASEACFSYLERERARWDIADLNDIRRDSSLDFAATTLSSDLGFHRHCPVISLATTWDAQLASLGKNLRSNVGRRRRQLEKAVGAELQTVSDPAQLPDAMEALFRLHALRWNQRGVKGAFADPRTQRFHHEVAAKFLARGWLRLHILAGNKGVQAAFYCFSMHNRVYYYLSGFDPEISKFSPGNVMMAYALGHAIAEGAREFDLLRGDETYKYAWKAEDHDTVRRVLSHLSPRSQLGRNGHRFERFVERQGLKVQRRLWGESKDSRQKVAVTPDEPGAVVK